MKLEVGRVYVTRSGNRRYRVLAELEQLSDGVFAFVAQHINDVDALCDVDIFTPDGAYDPKRGETLLDLIREYREPVVHERWVAACRNHGGVLATLHDTEEQAREWVGRDQLISIQKVTFTEQPE